MDFLKIALIVNVVCVVLAIFSAAVLAWYNSESRTIVLAGSALAGAALVFLIQLRFELREEEERHAFSTQVTVDLETRAIAHPAYLDPAPPARDFTERLRITAEVAASDWLRANDVRRFDNDRRTLTRDFVVYDVAAYLSSVQYDWQIRREVHSDPIASGFTMERVTALSKPENCFRVNLNETLKLYHNAFAEVPLPNGIICLPPNSRIGVLPDVIVIENPFATVKFTVTQSPGGAYGKPRADGAIEVINMADGEPRYETDFPTIDVTVTRPALRVQHRDRQKYRDWTSALLEGMTNWFAPPSRSPVPPENAGK